MKALKTDGRERRWSDPDDLLNAAFQILVDFVESEDPGRFIYRHPRDKSSWNEVKELYKWWTRIRPRRRDPLMRKGLKRPPGIVVKKIPGTDHATCVLKRYPKASYPAYERALRKSLQLRIQWEEEDQRNLHRLVDVRLWLWT